MAKTKVFNSSDKTRQKFGAFLYSDPALMHEENDENSPGRSSSASFSRIMATTTASNSPSSSTTPSPSPPFLMSPWGQVSPYIKSPWTLQLPVKPSVLTDESFCKSVLIGSLVREGGHVYSLAASGGLLYAGSDSRNIRVWDRFKEHSGFKSGSGLVKAIVVWEGRVYTGHQDGKIRVWKSGSGHRRVGSLPTAKDYFKCAINPSAYVSVRRNRNVPWVKHYDAVSCMSVDMDRGLLYSGSWDKTFKVWRLKDSKCIESVKAHDDAVNAVVAGFDGLVFTGSADGTVKAWRRELVGKVTKHVQVDTLLELESAVTSLAVVNDAYAAVYAGSSDGLVNFWEREKHFVSYGGALRGHKLAVLCLAGAGMLVLSGSADKSICVWRRDAGGAHSCVSVLTGYAGPVKCLALEKDDSDNEEEEEEKMDRRGWILYSGSLDNSVNVWRLTENVEEDGDMSE